MEPTRTFKLPDKGIGAMNPLGVIGGNIKVPPLGEGKAARERNGRHTRSNVVITVSNQWIVNVNMSLV